MLENLALSENGFLFDARTGNTYTLNCTGAMLLRELIDGTSEEHLADRLIEKFDVASDVADHDVEQFLFRLKDLGVVGAEEETQ